MSSRFNGYRPDERPGRPSSEQLVDLHVYLVPPEIWREKFNNALNQNINDTVSLGFIRVDPETKISSLRDEIEQQLGSDLVPRDYVFLKSVGRSLTRLKSRQENQLKAKHFLPPQAYAPELYLLEATPEVRAVFAASSDGSTRPQTRTSYDYNPYGSQNRAYQDYRQPVASSPRRVPVEQPQEEEYLQPLSATPPQSPEPGEKPNQRDRRDKKAETNEDSGIAGFTPDTQMYKENQDDVLDRRKQRLENQELYDRLRAPSPGEVDDPSPDARTSREDLEAAEWERQRKEEQERQKREEEERKKQEEEEQRREEENRKKIAEEAKLLKTKSDEDLSRYPSPPPLRLASPDRDSQSAKERRKTEKEELLKELEAAREARRAAERHREELVRQAKQMQSKTQNRRNHARDVWKKRYFEEKKKTVPFEDQCNRLRHELDIVHKKLLSTLEGPKEKATKLQDIKPPSNKVGLTPGRNNFKIQATRLQHEIEDIRRRVEHAKMKLTGEIKLRNQAETELRALRAELTQKKINLTLSRNSHLTTYAPPATDMNFLSARTGITPHP